MISERTVQRLWAAGLAKRRALRAEDGREIRVLFPGFAAAQAGPDFSAARILIGGIERTGDVEVHLSPSGWRRHGHDRDGAYANVILHVAFRRDRVDARIGRLGGGDVAEVVLEPHLDMSAADLARWTAEPAPPPGVPDAAWLEAMGDRRFERAVARWKRLVSWVGPEEALYRELMAGLGYRRNKALFTELARLVPLDRIHGRPEAEIHRILQEASAGFPWRTVGVRPANRPSRRLRGMAAFAGSIGRASWIAAMRGAADPLRFFDPKGEGWIGAERARELWTSVVLPARGDGAAFAAWPALGESRRLREAREALGIAPLARLRQQWGLLEWRGNQF